jgi:hypothetical protein
MWTSSFRGSRCATVAAMCTVTFVFLVCQYSGNSLLWKQLCYRAVQKFSFGGLSSRMHNNKWVQKKFVPNKKGEVGMWLGSHPMSMLLINIEPQEHRTADVTPAVHIPTSPFFIWNNCTHLFPFLWKWKFSAQKIFVLKFWWRVVMLLEGLFENLESIHETGWDRSQSNTYLWYSIQIFIYSLEGRGVEYTNFGVSAFVEVQIFGSGGGA